MADATDPAAEMPDYQFPLATQYEANMILMPLAIGWLLQIGLAAIATDRGVRIFRKRSAIKALGSVPLGAPLLLLALTLNAAAALCNASELVMWMCLQQRSVDGLNLFTKADVAAPLLTGAAAVASQAFMILRCYKVLRSSGIYFAIPMFALLACALSGATWITVAANDLQIGDSDNDWIFYASLLWLGSSLLVDMGVTAALTLHLRKMLGQGFNKRTDSYVNGLIRLTFESFYVPTLMNLIATCVYATTFRNPITWNWSLVVSPSIPSFYLLSFLYVVERTYKQQSKHSTLKYMSNADHSSRIEAHSHASNATRALKDTGSVKIIMGDTYGPVTTQSPPPRPAPARFFSMQRPRPAPPRHNAIEITSVATSCWDAPRAWDIESSVDLPPMSNRPSFASIAVGKPDGIAAAEEKV